MMESKGITVVKRGKSSGNVLAASDREGEEVEGGHNSVVHPSMAKPFFGMVISAILSKASTISSHDQSPSIPSFTESQGSQGDKHLHGLCVFPNDELSSDGVICHNPMHCYPQSGSFEVELSETCQRRFVMFDLSGSKKRIIFHPSLANEYQKLLQCHHNASSILEPIPDAKARAVGDLMDMFISPPPSAFYCSAFDTMLPLGWRSALFTNGKEDQFHASDSVYVEEHGKGRASDCLSQENSEDLEALLWSDDDEMNSMGASPIVSTMSDNYCSSASGISNYSSCFNRKRKAVKEADTESTATSGNPTLKKVFCSNSDFLGSRRSGNGKEGLTLFDLSSGDEEASSSGSNNYQKQREQHCFAWEQAVKRETRKEKIQSALDLLRSIIPGGESMDASLVLDGAVQFVKNLQAEVQELEEGMNSA